MASKMLLLYGIPVGMLATWSLVSPYFVEERTHEPTPVISTDAPHPQSRPDSTGIMNGDLSLPDPLPDPAIAEVMPPMHKAAVLATGNFSAADQLHQGIGTATIYKAMNGQQWLHFENFYVTDGSDLVVYLTQHHAPSNSADVTRGFTKIGQLKSNTGDQNYKIPAQINPAHFGAAIIWSESSGVLFSTAPLSVTETGHET